MYKATVIDFNVGIPNEHLIEDILFNIICFNRAKNIICIDKPFYNYNRRESNMDSVTNVFLEDYFDQHYRRVEEFYS